MAAHLVRATVGVRNRLVGMRTEMIDQIRGLMKSFGLILPKGSGARFEANVRARLAELALEIEPLPAVWRALDDHIEALECPQVRRGRRHEVRRRLMTVPLSAERHIPERITGNLAREVIGHTLEYVGSGRQDGTG